MLRTLLHTTLFVVGLGGTAAWLLSVDRLPFWSYTRPQAHALAVAMPGHGEVVVATAVLTPAPAAAGLLVRLRAFFGSCIILCIWSRDNLFEAAIGAR